MKRKTKMKPKKYLHNWILLKNKYSILVLVLFLLFGFFNIYSLTIGFISKTYLENQLYPTAMDITKNASNQEEAVKMIMQWQKEKMTNTYMNIPATIICPRIIGHENPSWILLSKCGACEEHALIFTELANSINITARSIHSHGEDHNLAEVLLNNQWISVDPSMNWFNVSPLFYDNNWGNRSYVYAIDKNGASYDVTDRYTGTGTITVELNDNNGLSIENASVIIGKNSNENIMEKPCLTDSNGICKFNLGGNITYKITAINGNFLKFSNQKQAFLAENETVEIKINPNNFDILRTIPDYIQNLVIVLILWISIAFYIIGIKAGIGGRLLGMLQEKG